MNIMILKINVFIMMLLLYAILISDGKRTPQSRLPKINGNRQSAPTIAKSKFSKYENDKLSSLSLRSKSKPSYWFLFKSFWLTLVHPTYYADVLSRELKGPKSLFRRKANAKMR